MPAEKQRATKTENTCIKARSDLRWEKFRSEITSLYDGVLIRTLKLKSSVEYVELSMTISEGVSEVFKFSAAFRADRGIHTARNNICLRYIQ
jgi:hypothetical protein